MDKKVIFMKMYLLFALFLIPAISASALILDSQDISACATDQLMLTGILENTKSLDDSYTLNVESDEGLSAFVSPMLKVEGFGRAQFRVFLSPVCLSSGPHDYKIIATSSRGENLETQGRITISECNLMELRLTQNVESVCNGEFAVFNLYVRNLGNERQNFRLSTDLQSSSYTLSQTGFSLEPKEEKRAQLTLSIPKDQVVQGMLNFHVNAQSTYSCGSNSRDIVASVNVKRCDGLKITALKELEVQAATTEKWNIFFDNQKVEDTFDLSLKCPSFARLLQNSISLGSLERQSVDVLISPKVENTGAFDCEFKAVSRKFGKEYSANLRINVVQGFDAKLEMPSSIRICSGESKSIQMKLINPGNQNKYTISASGAQGNFDSKQINVGKASFAQFAFKTSPNLAIGEYNLQVNALSPYVSVKGSTKLIVEDCYSTGLKLEPSQVEVCAGMSTNAIVRATNLGTQQDSFVISIKSQEGIDAVFQSEKAFRLNPGEKRDVRIGISATDGIRSGNYEIIVKSSGTKSQETANLKVRVLDTASCHSLLLTTDETMRRTGAGVGKSFRVMVTNNGKFIENVDLNLVKKPSWAYITPTKLEILPGKKEEALIYIAPQLNEKLGEYVLELEASGKFIKKSLELRVQVIALETDAPAKINLENIVLPLKLESETLIPLKIKITNDGDSDITKATIFFSEFISVGEQDSFDLPAGKTMEIPVVVELEKGVLGNKKVKIGVYAKEGFAEKNYEFEAIENPLKLEVVSKEDKNESEEITLKIVNEGEEMLVLMPQNSQGVTYDYSEIKLLAKSENTTKITIANGTKTIKFLEKTSGKIYIEKLDAEGEGAVTGLFLVSLGKVLPWILLVIFAFIAIYIFAKKRNEKKTPLDSEDGKSQIYEGDDSADDSDAQEFEKSSLSSIKQEIMDSDDTQSTSDMIEEETDKEKSDESGLPITGSFVKSKKSPARLSISNEKTNSAEKNAKIAANKNKSKLRPKRKAKSKRRKGIIWFWGRD